MTEPPRPRGDRARIRPRPTTRRTRCRARLPAHAPDPATIRGADTTPTSRGDAPPAPAAPADTHRRVATHPPPSSGAGGYAPPPSSGAAVRTAADQRRRRLRATASSGAGVRATASSGRRIRTTAQQRRRRYPRPSQHGVRHPAGLRRRRYGRTRRLRRSRATAPVPAPGRLRQQRREDLGPDRPLRRRRRRVRRRRLLGWIGPLVALLAKGNESPVVRAHAVDGAELPDHLGHRSASSRWILALVHCFGSCSSCRSSCC